MELNRRQAIGAIGAFAGWGLLPSWRTFAQRKTIDLAPFCDDSGSRRYAIGSPFAQDGMVYGTDGRILCRTTLADIPQLGDAARLPAASKLPWWDRDEQTLRWRTWPSLNLISDGELTRCPVCFGRGCLGDVRKHLPCDGDGYVFCDRDEASDWDGERHTKECVGCQGTGYVSSERCSYCGGHGSTTRPGLQRVGELIVAGHYDARVRSLGDVEYAIVANDRKSEDSVGPGQSLVRFRGDGFSGLLMPMIERGA